MSGKSAKAKAAKATQDPPAAKPATTNPRPRRWLRRVLLLGLLVAAVWCAPQLIARTGLHQQILPLALSQYPGKVECGSAQLDWRSPVVLNDLTFCDLDGRPLVHIDRIASGRPMWEIITHTSDPGHFRIERPQVLLALREGGSNLEDVAAQFLGGATSSGSSVGFSAEIVDGLIQVIEAGSDRPRPVLRFNVQASQPLDASQPLKLAASILPGEAGQSGSLAVEMNWPQDGGGGGEATLAARHFPLGSISPLLARLTAGAEANGSLDGEIKTRLTSEGENLVLAADGGLAVSQLDLLAPGWIGADRLHVDAINVGGSLRGEKGMLRVENAKFQSDVGEFELGGEFPLKGGGAFTERLIAAVREGVYRGTGRIDVARVARVLPQTLRLRDGIQMTGGEIACRFESVAADGHAWQAELSALNLAALSHGEPIRWEKPLRLSLTARERSGAVEIENLVCESDFLQLSGRGSLSSASLRAECNLNRLSAELSRFVDLGSITLAGQMTGDCTCSRREGDEIAVSANVLLSNFEFVAPERQPWREQRLEMALLAGGRLSGSRFESGRLENFRLTSGGDQLVVEPAAAQATAAGLPLQIRLSGNLQTWLARVAPWAGLTDWQAAGQIQATGRVVVGQSSAQFENVAADLQGLSLRGGGGFIDEQRARLVTSGEIDWAKGRFTSNQTTWASNSLSLKATDVSVRFGGSAGPEFQGAVAFRGGLDELVRWTRDPRLPRTLRLFGVASGTVQAVQNGSTIDAGWNLAVDNLVIARQTLGDLAWNDNIRPDLPSQDMLTQQTILQDRRAVCSGRARLDQAAQSIELSSLEASAGGLGLKVQGRVAEFRANPNIELSGGLTYNLEQVMGLLHEYVGDELIVSGTGERSFALSGPVYASPATVGRADVPVSHSSSGVSVFNASMASGPRRTGLKGDFGFNWVSANAYGLPVGPGALQARLDRGVLDLEPLDVQVGEGRLTTDAQIDLDWNDPTLVATPGPLVSNVRLSPELCRQWMKYLAPMAADAAQCDGRFSVNLTSNRVPLLRARDAEVAGVLQIHSADVRPGSSMQQLVTLVRQVRSILKREPLGAPASSQDAFLTFPAQDVEFQVANGRVFHKSLQFVVGDTSVRSSGSVGFDQTLDLVAEIPIRDEWVQNDRYTQALRGQAVRVPIRGTLSAPQIDQRILGQLAQQIGGAAAGSAIQDAIGKQINRLFGK